MIIDTNKGPLDLERGPELQSYRRIAIVDGWDMVKASNGKTYPRCPRCHIAREVEYCQPCSVQSSAYVLENPHEHASRRFRPRRPMPPLDPDTAETLRQLRMSIRRAMGKRTIEQASGEAACSTNTIARILRNENVTIHTASRILGHLGWQMTISISPKLQA